MKITKLEIILFIFILNNFKLNNLFKLYSNTESECFIFDDEKCIKDDQFHVNEGVSERRWQTPKPDSRKYQKSYQDYHSLVGYADIRYLNSSRIQAEVCIIAIHKNINNITLKYYFNNIPQSSNCKIFDSNYKEELNLSVKASDNTKLEIDPIVFVWNNGKILERKGDYRKGQKGAIVELFGWKYQDIQKECDLISKSGYLGIKLSPVHEHLMSTEPISNTMNPWFFMYQPVSFRFNSRAGTREELLSLINTCRSLGVRVYVDLIINHFTGKGNDLDKHRDPSSDCAKWDNKTTSAPLDRQSPFYTHGYTYKLNENTGKPPSNEFPAAAIGPEDFHCERSLNRWDDLFILNNGWLVGLTDLDTSKENVRERLASYIAELISFGVSGFRVDAAKHLSPEDLSVIFKKVKLKLGGQFPDDFILWLEILTGGENYLLWDGPSWYGHMFYNLLKTNLNSETEIEKIKIFDGLYPARAWDNRAVSKKRIVIQNDDHDSQTFGFTRDLGPNGCVLVKKCPIEQHRYYETRLFDDPYGVENNNEDWPIRIILSSYYFTYGSLGIPDGLSDCNFCKTNCEKCTESIPFISAHVPGECGYVGNGYTKVHRDIKIINSMRKWIGLEPISGYDINLPLCN